MSETGWGVWGEGGDWSENLAALSSTPLVSPHLPKGSTGLLRPSEVVMAWHRCQCNAHAFCSLFIHSLLFSSLPSLICPPFISLSLSFSLQSLLAINSVLYMIPVFNDPPPSTYSHFLCHNSPPSVSLPWQSFRLVSPGLGLEERKGAPPPA